MPRTPQKRVARWMHAGAWSVRHWRGMLMGAWLATFGVFALLAWWGFENRDHALGSFAMTIFGLVSVAMLFRFPKKLFRAMWLTRRGGRQLQKSRDDGIVDAKGTLRPRPTLPRPPARP